MKLYSGFFLFFVYISGADVLANCINPLDYARSTVAIGGEVGPDRFAFGTAWFYEDKKTIVTAGHVAQVISSQNFWSKLEYRQREKLATVVHTDHARILNIGKIAGATGLEVVTNEQYAREDLAIIELAHPYREALPLKISLVNPIYDSVLWSIAYPRIELSVARGRTLPPGAGGVVDKDFASMVHVEIEGNRQTLVEGSSGSPLINCRGEVTATVTTFINDFYISSNGKLVRRGTGTATNRAVPASFIGKLISRK